MRKRLIDSDRGQDRRDRGFNWRRLHPTVPVVLRHAGVTLDHVTRDVGLSEIIDDRFTALRFGLEDTISDLGVGRAGTGLKRIINDVKKAPVITTVDGPMPVVEEHIIHKREISIHAHTRITSRITGPKIVVKRAIQPANRAAKGVVIDV